MKWRELPTPALLIDLDRLRSNADWMRRRCRDLGVTLRPHVKTHKSVEAARLQCGGEAGPITVSTIAEAEFFAQGGFRDITYAVCATPDKLPRLAAVQELVDRLNLLLDHEEALVAAENYCRGAGTRLRFLLKVDCGYHRAGVAPDDDGVALARRMHESKEIDLVGILAHGGHSYDACDPDGIRLAADEERDSMSAFAAALRRQGIDVSTVSIGSTPTISRVDHLEGITEARPGCYLLFDHFQVSIGTTNLERCAVTVAAQIIGLYPERNQLIVDAGALALSKDPGATQVEGFSGYGKILGHDELLLRSLSQEHGLVEARGAIDWSRLAIGQRLRIVPNHACLATALFPSYSVVHDGSVVDEWRPVRGW